MTSTRPAPAWAIGLGFILIYFTWGTTYLATGIGVRDERMPPLLFGGTRIVLAGCLLLAWQVLRGVPVRVGWHELPAIVGTSMIMFVCGNGLINIGQQTVESSMAAVLAATMPLWIGLFSMLLPHGERLTWRGWLGLFVGLAGVMILLGPKLGEPTRLFDDLGWLCVLGSAVSWSIASLLTRHFKPRVDHLTGAAYHLLCGGIALSLVGFILGERVPHGAEITDRAAQAFLYLLIVGSLMGFVAFNWLLGHVSAAKVSTHAYVNPAVAVLVGWCAGETMSAGLVSGIAVILAGVFLVRGGEAQPAPPSVDVVQEPVLASVESCEVNPG